MAFEMRHLLYCAGVIVCLGLLFSAIPSAVISPLTTTPTVPGMVPTVELSVFAETDDTINNYTFFTDGEDGYRYYSFTLGGKSWVARINNDSVGPAYTAKWLQVGVKRTFLGLWVNTDWLLFMNASGYSRGDNLTVTEMNIDDNMPPTSYVKYQLAFEENPADSLTLFVSAYDETYYDASNAFERRVAYLIFGYGVSNETVDLGSGLGFFLSLLTFQTPNIHPWINILAWVIIGVPISYVIFELLRSLIPFLS